MMDGSRWLFLFCMQTLGIASFAGFESLAIPLPPSTYSETHLSFLSRKSSTESNNFWWRDRDWAVLRLFDEQQYPNARCLDGSMAGYYLREGSSLQRYLIFFQGGGWCYDQECNPPTRNGTLRNCRERAKTRLGSSKDWWKHKKFSWGMQSGDWYRNPVFYNWTLVYVPYCDGASLTGSAEVEGLHFRGKDIRAALIDTLKATSNISSADMVVLSGGSAGASTVLWHGDEMAERLGLGSRVVAIPDAGFFLDLRDERGVDCWPSQMRSLMDTIGGYDDLHQACLSTFPTQKWKCMFPEYYAGLISTRTFILHSLYDSSELYWTLWLNCCQRACSKQKTSQCSASDMHLFEELRPQHMQAWRQLVEKPDNGVWAPACVAHTMTEWYWNDETWAIPKGSGNTMASVVARWLDGDNSDGKQFEYQDVPWPGNGACLDPKGSGSAARDIFLSRGSGFLDP